MSKLKPLNKEFISNLKTHKITTDAKRNLILSILKSTTTKREAKNYLTKYLSQFDFAEVNFKNSLPNGEVFNKESQRNIFINRYLNKQNPFLNVYDEYETKLKKIPLRIAIFKIKFVTIKRKEWDGIAETLKRLTELGVSPIIILDYDHLPLNNFKNNEFYMINQVNKVLRYLDNGSLKTTPLRSLFSTQSNDEPIINGLEQLIIPMYQNIIPIVQPIIFNPISGYQEFLKSEKLLNGLCKSLLRSNDLLTIEKIVFVDPIGGIPSIERNESSHVFINLSQEYSDIISELYIGHILPSLRELHLNNLNSMNDNLSTIAAVTNSNDSTGVITTPSILSINNDEMNPIIYNVLTDRLIISSSLPSSSSRTPELSTTIIKKGASVEVYDNDRYPEIKLENLFRDGLVDRKRLIDLLNDSFGKELDVELYISRINDNIATLILVGDYDGVAIITWETSKEHGSEKIAYLDKFAIAKRNQGLPGLADIIFKSMIQAHPNELLWRSRSNNPVNKWYFERCSGSLSPENSQWRIFFIGELFSRKITRTKLSSKDGFDINKKIQIYTSICESIPPSFMS